jgi:hypothetical protein
MRLVFLTMCLCFSSLIFSQNELLLPVQEITEINPAVVQHIQKSTYLRSGVFNNFRFLNVLSPLVYRYYKFDINLQYQSSQWKDKKLNNNVLSLDYGSSIKLTRRSSLGFGAKIKGYNLAEEPTLSGDIGLTYFREKYILSYTLINPWSNGTSILEPIHHFYGNGMFSIALDSAKSG